MAHASGVRNGTRLRPTTALRQSAFFGLDKLRGGTISNHVRDIAAILGNPVGGGRRDEHLRKLLTHAATTVPFYREMSQATIDSLALAELPVIDKRVYQDRFDDLCSRAFDPATLPTVSTSGSTGTPLRVPRDPDKRKRHVADLITFGRLAGYNVGDPVMFATVSRGHGASLVERMQGIRYVRAETFDERLVGALVDGVTESSGGVYVFGIPSSLDYIGRTLAQTGRRLPSGRVTGIMAISEATTPWLREHGHEVFGAPLYSRYANEENGILAQQTADSDGRFVVNHASYLVEILAVDGDRPVADGELGRIVITDLFARAVPFIRYDTGDLGRMAEGGEQVLTEVVGRRGDIIYGDEGQAIHPQAVLYELLPFDDIRQFQVAQVDRFDHRLSVVAAKDPARDAAIEAALRERLGQGVTVRIDYVDEIQPLASGKRRPVANLWKDGGT